MDRSAPWRATSSAGGSPRPSAGADLAAFPWWTLGVNVLGSFAIGLFLTLLAWRRWSEAARLLVAVGFLGGFTTFSAFSWETLGLVRAGEMGLALGYVAASVGLGLIAVMLGVWLGRRAASARPAPERAVATAGALADGAD